MPSRSFHTIETDVAAGHVLNKGCFPKTPPGLTQRASQGSAGTLCHPHSEHFLAKLRGGERPRPRGPQNGGGAGLCLADLQESHELEQGRWWSPKGCPEPNPQNPCT